MAVFFKILDVATKAGLFFLIARSLRRGAWKWAFIHSTNFLIAWFVLLPLLWFTFVARPILAAPYVPVVTNLQKYLERLKIDCKTEIEKYCSQTEDLEATVTCLSNIPLTHGEG